MIPGFGRSNSQQSKNIKSKIVQVVPGFGTNNFWSFKNAFAASEFAQKGILKWNVDAFFCCTKQEFGVAQVLH